MSDDIVSVPLPTSKRFVNLTGKTFERLEVVGFAGMKPVGHTGRQNGAFWICKCRCGSVVEIYSHALLNEINRSCGCLQKESSAELKKTHGESYSVEYDALHNIIQRCTNKNHPQYDGYGGRGITVCDRWVNSVLDFIADVGRRPSPLHSIDRFPDNNGNYEPGNVRWATGKQQTRNRRVTTTMTHLGKTQSFGDWSDETGIPISILYGRKENQWSDEKCLTTPYLPRKKPMVDHLPAT